jgi:hypothetical protein
MAREMLFTLRVFAFTHFAGVQSVRPSSLGLVACAWTQVQARRWSLLEVRPRAESAIRLDRRTKNNLGKLRLEKGKGVSEYAEGVQQATNDLGGKKCEMGAES